MRVMLSNASALRLEEFRDLILQQKRPEVIPPQTIASGAFTYESEKCRIAVYADAPGSLKGKLNAPALIFVFSGREMDVSYDIGGKEVPINNIGAAVIPGETAYEIRHSGLLFIATVPSKEGSPWLQKPVGFTHRNIMRNLRQGCNKIVAPRNMYDDAHPRGGEVIDLEDHKYLIIGAPNQEFSAGNSRSPQDFHAHTTSEEIFVTFSGMRMKYITDGEENAVTAKPGSMLIVPTMVPHMSQMFSEKPTFVIKGGSKPIVDDKILIPPSTLKSIERF